MQRLEAITRQSLDPTTKILAGPFPLSHYPDWGVPAEACSAIVALDGGDLVVVAAAEDAHAFNRATADNQHTWELGDAMEFFVQVPGHEDYYEFHVTPEGRRLQLHLPSYLTFRQVSEASKICDCGLAVKSVVREGVWLSEMRESLARIGATSPRGLRFAVCRYNYGPVGEPELSTTMRDASRGFHNPPAWLALDDTEAPR